MRTGTAHAYVARRGYQKCQHCSVHGCVVDQQVRPSLKQRRICSFARIDEEMLARFLFELFIFYFHFLLSFLTFMFDFHF